MQTRPDTDPHPSPPGAGAALVPGSGAALVFPAGRRVGLGVRLEN